MDYLPGKKQAIHSNLNHWLMKIIRILRPLSLIFSFLMYLLGIGIARYLGAYLYGSLFFLGLIWLFAGQIGALFLTEYARLVDRPLSPQQKESLPLSQPVLLLLSAVFLTIVASCTVLIFQQITWQPGLLTIMAVMFLGAFLYAAPPRYLHKSGFDEWFSGIILCNLVPAFGFMLFSAQSLRLIAMSTFPLTALFLAMQLVIDLSTYASDIKNVRPTLVIRMGWERAMFLHNLLIFSSFLILVIAAWMGMPFGIVWPTFLILPVGLWQAWRIIRIGAGGRPNWKSLIWGAQLLLGITAYLLAFGFWIS